MRTWLVSNRLPFTLDAGGSLSRSHGGLVTALLPVHEEGDTWWVGQGGFQTRGEEEERFNAARVVDLQVPADCARRHYNGAANSGIWPLFHYFPAIASFVPEDWAAYRTVNRIFADSLLARIGPHDRVWIHDYHLMLLPGMLRRERPGLAIGYFHHIPFPASEVFKIHPARDEILSGLLGADVLGFHTLEYARHFAGAAFRLLGLVGVADEIHYEDRVVRVGAFPLGIDAEGLARALKSTARVTADSELATGLGGRRMILGVDRLDYTKGIPERLAAFELLLRRHPELRGQVVLVQICVPSRIEVARYEQLRDEVERTVSRINGTYGTPSSAPIHYIFQRQGMPALSALYRRAEVGLVTPLRDGLNLVCKEFCAAHADGEAVLVLSEFAGAAEEMGEALVVNPYDIEAVASALYAALTMPAEERRARMTALHRRVSDADNRVWAREFLTAMDQVQTANAANASRELSGADLEEHRRRLAVRPGLIAFDADIIARPDGRATSLATLAALAARYRHHLLLITAMPRDKAEGLAVGGAWIAAERGAFLRDPAGTWRVLPAGDPLGSTEAEVRRHLEQRVRLVPRSYLVANEASLHWHTGRRPLPLVDALLRESVHVLDTLLSRSPWHALRTHDGLVVRSAHLHSGNAMAAVAAAVGLAAGATLTVGDRYSDEELFRWGGATGCSIAMGTPLSVARYLVANQEELEAVLAALLGGEHV